LERPEIFISYAREDSLVVDNVRTSLQEAGYETWIDREGISGGEAWMDKIPKAIKHSRFFVLMISTASVKSKWVDKELKFASKNDRYILPVLLTSVKLPANWDFILGDSNIIDLSTNEAKGVQSLIFALKGQPESKPEQPIVSPSFKANAFQNLQGPAYSMKDPLAYFTMTRSRHLTAASEGMRIGDSRGMVRTEKAIGKKSGATTSVKTPSYDFFGDKYFWLVAGVTCLLSVVLAVLTGWAASLIPDGFAILPQAHFFPWVALVITGLVWGVAVVFWGVIEEPENFRDALKNTLLYPAGLYTSDDALSRAILLSPPFIWAGSLGLAFLGGWLARMTFGWHGSLIFYILFVVVFLVQLGWLFIDDITLYPSVLVIVACGWGGVLVNWFVGIITPILALQLSPPEYQLQALVIAGLVWSLFYCTAGLDYSTDWYDPLVWLLEPYANFASFVGLTGAFPFNLFFSWALAIGVLEGVDRFTSWDINPEPWVYIIFAVFSGIGILIYRAAREEI